MPGSTEASRLEVRTSPDAVGVWAVAVDESVVRLMRPAPSVVIIIDWKGGSFSTAITISGRLGGVRF